MTADARHRPGPAARPEARTVGSALGWTALAIFVAVLSAMLHLATPVGRAAAADGFAALLSSRVRGTAHVGSITRLDPGGVELHDFTITSPSGERVLTTERLAGEIAWMESLRRGGLVLTPCELEGGSMRLTRGPSDQIDLVFSMEVPDDRVMIPLELRDVRLARQTMTLALPGVPGAVEMRDVHGLADMTIDHQFVARLSQLRGYLNVPVVHIGFRHLGGRLQSDDPSPLVVRLKLDLEVADPSMEIRYHAPGAVGHRGSAGLGIELGADVPDEQHIGRPRETAARD
jgi:hypothetical protein